jgi:UDP-N-acetylglucosamine/UDP-N-acetylgalactosamine diphosphorylase
MPAPQQLQDLLTGHGQQHLIQFWDSLDDAGRVQLAEQIEAVDFEQIDALFNGNVDQPDWAALAHRATPPPAMRLADRASGGSGGLGFSPAEAIERGKAALRGGKVGVILVAGGQGSRLGFEHPKGMFPIGPLSGATLLQIHFEKVIALARKYDTRVPLYLMNSPVTNDEQLEFLAQHDQFGLPADDFFPFCQGTMPVVDAETGKLLLEAPDRLFQSPDGHGGTIAALAKSGATDHMRKRGIEHLFYLQVDNPIVPIGDPELIGYHLLAESELTSMAVAKQAPEEKLGNFVMIDERLHVIEYSDFPSDVADEREPDGSLRFWAGSIAVHVFATSFLERMLVLKDALPFHIANKKVPYLDSRGEVVSPTEPNALKFERFIFDLLPRAERPIVVEYAEADCFAPLKNAPGAPKDTAEYVQRFMLDQHRRWLTAAGAKVGEGVKVELNPLWAVDGESVAERVTEGLELDGDKYLVASE